jgi:hypothetical protein
MLGTTQRMRSEPAAPLRQSRTAFARTLCAGAGEARGARSSPCAFIPESWFDI